MTTKANLTLLLAVLTGGGVLAYNFWSYSCGYCTLHSLLTPGPAGYLLLGINLGLVVALLVLRQRRRNGLKRQQCRCGAVLGSDWRYCPSCGEEAGK